MFSGKSPAELDQEEREVLRRASQTLKASNPILEKVSPQKLDAMLQEALSVWIVGKTRMYEGASAPEMTELLKEVPGRVPCLEPYIRNSLGDVIKHMDLPFANPLKDWSAQDMLRMISASFAYALLAEKTAKDVPF